MHNMSHHSGPQDNAMTEIALALAMGFFSIMVLAMVSMGVGGRETEKPSPIAAVTVAETAAETTGNGAISPTDDDTLIIFDGSRYFDRALEPIDLKSIASSKRVILAIDPSVPLSSAIGARRAILADDVVVATLNQRWRDALAERAASER